MTMPTKRSRVQDQRRLSAEELEAPVTFKHESIILTFAVSMALEVFRTTVTSLLGQKFWKRLEAESKRGKNHPFGYAFHLINK